MTSIVPEASPSGLLIRNALPETIVTGRLVLRQPSHNTGKTVIELMLEARP
jgi:hypothetical protein